MNDAPRQTLRKLIAAHGPGLCSDARRCEGLLRDLSGAHRREINILMGALRERVPLDLLAGRNSVPRDLLLMRLSKRLEDHLALTAEAARWAVDSWALALGIISDAELEERARRPSEDAAPRVEATPRPPSPPTPTHAVSDDTTESRPPTNSRTRPPATSPPATSAPPTSPPFTSPPPRAQPHTPSPPASPPPLQRRQTMPPKTTQTPPLARPSARVPSAPTQPSNTGRLPAPVPEPPAESVGRRWRGCLVGCLLLILLAGALFAGVPFVLSVLREEQQQRSLESPPVQTR